MCMIIYNEKGVVIDGYLLSELIDYNADGAGIIWLDTWKVDHNADPELLRNSERPYIAHLRYATKGKVAGKNSHPFSIGRGRYLMHNGTIDKVGNKIVSDTNVFSKAIRGLPSNNQDQLISIVSISTDSRMAVIDCHRRAIKLFGAKAWENGRYDEWTEDYNGIIYSKCPYTQVMPHKFSTLSCVWGSDSASQEDLEHPVFVYGTLKQGHGNNRLLSSSIYSGTAVTTEGYILEDGVIPYLHEVDDITTVSGELYYVDSVNSLQALDNLEGHPHHYERKLIEAYSEEFGEWVTCWAYHAGHPLPKMAVLTQEYTGRPKQKKGKAVTA